MRESEEKQCSIQTLVATTRAISTAWVPVKTPDTTSADTAYNFAKDSVAAPAPVPARLTKHDAGLVNSRSGSRVSSQGDIIQHM